jgi:polyisoprenoid-binding protein YceI
MHAKRYRAAEVTVRCQARFRATARLDRTAFGITRMKGRVGRIADLTIEAVALIGR